MAARVLHGGYLGQWRVALMSRSVFWEKAQYFIPLTPVTFPHITRSTHNSKFPLVQTNDIRLRLAAVEPDKCLPPPPFRSRSLCTYHYYAYYKAQFSEKNGNKIEYSAVD